MPTCRLGVTVGLQGFGGYARELGRDHMMDGVGGLISTCYMEDLYQCRSALSLVSISPASASVCLRRDI